MPHKLMPQLKPVTLPAHQQSRYQLRQSLQNQHFLIFEHVDIVQKHCINKTNYSIQLLAKILVSQNMNQQSRYKLFRYIVDKCVPSPRSNQLGQETMRYLLLISVIIKQIQENNMKSVAENGVIVDFNIFKDELFDPIYSSIQIIIKNQQIVEKTLIMLTAAQVLVLLVRLLKGKQRKRLQDFIKQLKSSLQLKNSFRNTQDLVNSDPSKSESQTVMGGLIVGNMMRYFDKETLLQNSSRLSKMITNLTKIIKHTTRHISQYIIFITFKYNGEQFIDVFKHLFSQSYYQLIVDLRQDQHLQASFILLSGICVQSPNLLSLVNQNRIHKTVQQVLKYMNQQKDIQTSLILASLFCLRQLQKTNNGIQNMAQSAHSLTLLLPKLRNSDLKINTLYLLSSFMLSRRQTRKAILHKVWFEEVLIKELQRCFLNQGMILSQNRFNDPVQVYGLDRPLQEFEDRASFFAGRDKFNQWKLSEISCDEYYLKYLQIVFVLYCKEINSLSYIIELINDALKWINNDQVKVQEVDQESKSDKQSKKKISRQFGCISNDVMVFLFRILRKQLEITQQDKKNIFKSKRYSKGKSSQQYILNSLEQSAIQNLKPLLRLISFGSNQKHQKIKVESLFLIRVLMKVSKIIPLII